MNTKEKIETGMSRYYQHLQSAQDLYLKLLEAFQDGHIIHLNSSPFFDEILSHFGPALDKASIDLRQVYNAALHVPTGSLIVASKGMDLPCISPITNVPYTTRHIGATVYRPGLGVEVVNVGLVGNVHDGELFFRYESACPPAFYFGSQRCDCFQSWVQIRELAATLKPNQGAVMMHIDSQSGKGGGFSPGTFSFDLSSRAFLRQLGEVDESFQAIGIPEDCREEEDNIGFQLGPIVLDWLGVNKSLTFFSKNRNKMKVLTQAGYQLK